MTAIIVVLMLVGFVAIDVVVRAVSQRIRQKRILREREAVLKTTLRLEISPEAKSLRRSEVPDPRARILAVDDEPVVLDSLRKILVLEGFSVDTVESGPEALGLVQRRDYDFVFTDLKMPGMDGVEVVKAVHHLRPDADIAVITGYATIESAVETMQHGAVAYVEKPFTSEELAEFARTLLIKREARHESQRRPTVRVVAPSLADTVAGRDFCVPGGTFLASGHTWARLETDGRVRVGLDDFARKALGAVQGIDLPRVDQIVRRGEALFVARRGERKAELVSPISGRVTEVNVALAKRPSVLSESPYDRGWICRLEPTDLAGELADLRIGEPVIEWYREEIDRLRAAGGEAEGGAPSVDWRTIEERFLKAGIAVPTRV